MRRLSLLLVLVLLFTVLSIYPTTGITQAAAGTPAVKNIKISANEVNIREDVSANSKILATVSKNSVYELLSEAKDTQGRAWYKVDAEFGVTGWVAGWLCNKTNEKINSAVKSRTGELLISCSNKELFIKLLLIEDYSIKNLINTFGKSYTVKPDFAYKRYEYKNGVNFEVDEDGEVVTVGVGDRTAYIDSIRKITCDIFSKNKGNEKIILDSSNIIIVDAATKKVLREYATKYPEIANIQFANFLGDMTPELYLCSSEVYENSEPVKKAIYKVVNDDFIKVCDENSFNEYKNGIKAEIDRNLLSLSVNIGGYTDIKTSVIPNKVFYNTKATADRNKLLSISTDWIIVQENRKWYVKVINSVNIAMLTYYWGPLDENMEDNSTMYSDPARISILLDLGDGTPAISSVESKVKYDNDKLISIKDLEFEEAALKNGPVLGMTMEEAYASLGGKLKQDEYSENMMTYKDVELFEYCGSIVDIYTKSPNYSTTRGIKVGDSIEKVESLYGKPDIGFSGDDLVQYKFCYVNENTFYRTMKIYYKDGLVSAIQFHQVIFD